MKIGIFWGKVLLCYVNSLEEGLKKMDILRNKYNSVELRQFN